MGSDGGNMFVCSVRAGTIRFFGAVFLALTLFLTVLVLCEPGGTVAAGGGEDALAVANYAGIKTDEDRVAFLSSFGWEVSAESPIHTAEFLLPDELDRVLSGYNELQKAQGLDLARYCGKRVTRYTYEVTNYEGYEGKVYANLIMYKNKIVAADVTSADPHGFVHGLKK